MIDGQSSELAPALEDLHDAFARVKAQVHVIKLAMCVARDECDIRALMSSLAAIEDDLRFAEKMIHH